MSDAVKLVLLWGVLTSWSFSCAMMDYCKNHTFDHVVHKDLMHFSKENSEQEYAVIDRFKSLHCCTHGYRSIEWFKDGRPYPWPADISTLIIYPESGNQTIYSQVTAEVDTGGYWCIVRNDTHFLRHDVLLKVSGSVSSVGPPKTTYRPRDQYVKPGHSARFYCEAYVGNINLPDARSEITWERSGLNGTVPEDSRLTQFVVVREEKQVLGSYLIVSDVKRSDFGQYTCRISNTGDQTLELKAWLREQETSPMDVKEELYPSRGFILVLCLAIVTAVVVTLALRRFGLQLKLIYKRMFRRPKSPDGKTSDVMVLFHENDADVALEKMVSRLHNRYGYSCASYSVSDVSAEEETLRCRAEVSRRLMIIVTPSVTKWTCHSLSEHIGTLLRIHSKVICVFFEPLPSIDLKQEPGRRLTQALSKVHCIFHQARDERSFWALVRLGMPVRNKPMVSIKENLEEFV